MNIFKRQIDKGIEDKQTKVGLNCCKTTHCGKTVQGKDLAISNEYDYN